MKNKILKLLSFLTILFYGGFAWAGPTGSTPLEKIVADLSAGNTQKVINEYLYFDGPRLWVLLAAMLIAVNIVGLASEIGKDLGGAQLGGSVGNTGLAITGAAAGFVAGKAVPVAGKEIKKGINKLKDKFSQDPTNPKQPPSTPSAGANDYRSPNSDDEPKPSPIPDTEGRDSRSPNSDDGPKPSPIPDVEGSDSRSSNSDAKPQDTPNESPDTKFTGTNDTTNSNTGSSDSRAESSGSGAEGDAEGSSSEGAEPPVSRADTNRSEMPGRGEVGTLGSSGGRFSSASDRFNENLLRETERNKALSLEEKVNHAKETSDKALATADHALDEAKKKQS